jgi:hypothetical protein
MSELVAILGLAFLFAVFGMLRLADRSGAPRGCHGCSHDPAAPECGTCEVAQGIKGEAALPGGPLPTP